MNDLAKIALLWIIRDKKSITVREVYDLLNSSPPSIISRSVIYDLSNNLRLFPKHALEDLIKVGLIITSSGESDFYDTRLIPDPKLPVILGMFDISLTQLLKAPGKFTKAYPIFGEPPAKFNKQWAKIFVAMPFLDKLKPIYSDHILKVTQELEISCKRGDDFFSTNSIINDIWSAIYYSDICIVDCTDRNPNVFYELGIAHTLGRRTVLIAQNMEDIPFDIRHLRVIIYQYSPPGMLKFEKTLKQTIQAEMSS